MPIAICVEVSRQIEHLLATEDIFWSESAADGSQVRADGASFITEAVAGATLGSLIGLFAMGEGSPRIDLIQLRVERFPGP